MASLSRCLSAQEHAERRNWMNKSIEPTRLDLKTDFKCLYTAPRREVVIVEVPALYFLMLDGKGDPNAQGFKDAIEALYTVAYTTRFLLKREAAIDYPVMPLEGLWWADGGRE